MSCRVGVCFASWPLLCPLLPPCPSYFPHQLCVAFSSSSQTFAKNILSPVMLFVLCRGYLSLPSSISKKELPSNVFKCSPLVDQIFFEQLSCAVGKFTIYKTYTLHDYFKTIQSNIWLNVKEMATHSSILAWKIPWTEEPGGPQSIGSPRSWTWLRDNSNNIHNG